MIPKNLWPAALAAAVIPTIHAQNAEQPAIRDTDESGLAQRVQAEHPEDDVETDQRHRGKVRQSSDRCRPTVDDIEEWRGCDGHHHDGNYGSPYVHALAAPPYRIRRD